MERRYKICWRMVADGKTGEGAPCLLREDADVLVMALNDRHEGGMVHWVEGVEVGDDAPFISWDDLCFAGVVEGDEVGNG